MALDVTGPVAAALHEVRATAEGIFSGAGDYWDAARQNGELKREPRDAPADGRGQGDLPGEPATQSCVAVAPARPGHGRHRPDCRLVLRQPTPLRNYLRRRRDGIRQSMPVSSPDGLVGRSSTSASWLRGCFCLRPHEHRSRAATSNRSPGYRAGARRRHLGRSSAQGRPQSVQAGRFHHHFGDRRALSAARVRSPGS